MIKQKQTLELLYRISISKIIKCSLFLIIFLLLFLFSPVRRSASSSEVVYTATELEPKIIDIKETKVSVLPEYQYYKMAAIKDGEATLYENNSYNKKNIIVCVNAGHGTYGGGNKWVYAHPDKSYKYSSQYQVSSSKMSMAISQGAQYRNGVTEAMLNLKVSKFLKDMLLENGYSVLMIRETADVRLDNIARSILANEYADIEVSVHFDSTENNKGLFYISPVHHPDYLSRYNIRTTYEDSERLGDCIVEESRGLGVKIFGKGKRRSDMTQFSYSRIPNIIVECGDGWTDSSNKNLYRIAEGLYHGIKKYFNQ